MQAHSLPLRSEVPSYSLIRKDLPMMEGTRTPSPIRRRNLLIARVGDRSLHRTWLSASGDRCWDLQLSSYGSGGAFKADGDLPFSIDRGTKWDSIFRHLSAHPELFDRYDYIAFPDDDLSFEAGSLNHLFNTCREFDLYVAQPGLTRRSYYSHPITLRCPAFRLRYTNYVEGMAPCFKSSYLRSILPELAGWYSGWGIARAWALRMQNPAKRAAIIDEAPMTHTRPLLSGTIYKDLEQLNVDPQQELERIRAYYDGIPSMMTTYGGRLRNGAPCGGFRARAVNGLYLVGLAPLLKPRKFALLSGMRMMVRAFTQSGYQPVQLRRKRCRREASNEAFLAVR